MNRFIILLWNFNEDSDYIRLLRLFLAKTIAYYPKPFYHYIKLGQPSLQTSFREGKDELIWFDENIYNENNKMLFNKLKNNFPNLKGFQSLDEGLEYFYQNSRRNYDIILVVVSGQLFGRYVKKINENLNKIINIPYTFIFTSINFKNILLNSLCDTYHILSYDTKVNVNSGFYNPGGVYDCFENLLRKIRALCKKMSLTKIWIIIKSYYLVVFH